MLSAPLGLFDRAKSTPRQVSTRIDIIVFPTGHSPSCRSKLGSKSSFSTQESDAQLDVDRMGRIGTMLQGVNRSGKVERKG